MFTPVKSFIIAVVWILSWQYLTAQVYNNSISGIVIDQETLKPIENANVYIANTTFGSSTDRNGQYIIKSIPPNIHDLIVSIVGYKTEELKIVIQKTTKLKQDFRLKSVVYEVSEIDITAEIPEEWLSNLNKFKNIFLGQTFRVKHCEIVNPEVLDFVDANSILTASIQKPLHIKNTVLGYNIYCNSLDFSYDYGRNTWNWIVKPRYEEIVSSDSIQILKWRLNREIAYFGSMYHFLMALKQNKLEDLGYHLFVSDKLNVSETAEKKALFKVERDSIISEGYNEKFHIVKFKKYLLIRNYDIEDQFTQYTDLDLQIDQTFQESWLNLKYDEMTIDEYGYPQEENASIVYGYWAKLGIADLLPRYFTITSKSKVN